MDKYLPNGFKLSFNNREGYYIITGLKGRGASTVAYYADYYGVSGKESKCLIKEYNPNYISFSRSENGEIIVDIKQKARFDEGKDHFCSTCNTQINIRNNNSMMNSTPAVEGPFEQNNTVYIHNTINNGQIYEDCAELSLLDRMKVCAALVKLVGSYHNAGYLCLDLKPANIFVMNETKELIQYIDYDSIRRKAELSFGVSLSYTKTWAAPEQTNIYGNDEVAETTDIYALGEIIFWSVFGRHSKESEHRGFSEYPFSESSFNDELDRLDVRRCLTEIFRNTLRSSPSNRYETVNELSTALKKLINCLREKLYVISSPINVGLCLGRNNDIRNISQKINEKSPLFITGVGGIGKSTVAKQFFVNNREKYDIALFLEYDGDFKRNFAEQVYINNFSRDITVESIEEFYERQRKAFLKCISNKRILIVIDDCVFEKYGDFNEILPFLDECWDVLFFTRCKPLQGTFCEYELSSIQDRDGLYQIFENYSNIRISDENQGDVDTIINMIEGHTLVLELIARQISNKHITIKEATKLTRKHGFSNIGSEKISIFKDNHEMSDTIPNIIISIFNTSKLNSNAKSLLKIMSLAGTKRVYLQVYQRLMDLQSFDLFNELQKYGWIIIENDLARLHSVIAEVIDLWEWTEDYCSVASKIMRNLVDCIVPSVEKQSELYTEERGEWIYGYGKTRTKIIRTEVKWLNRYLIYAMHFLEKAKTIDILFCSKEYWNLLFQTIKYAPVHNEQYILSKSEFILENEDKFESINIMEIYDKVLHIYLERGNYQTAEKALKKAEEYKLQFHNDERKRLEMVYYRMYMDYHENTNTLEPLKKTTKFIYGYFNGLIYSETSEDFAELQSNSLLTFLKSGTKSFLHNRLFFKQLKAVREELLPNTDMYSIARFNYYMCCTFYYSLYISSFRNFIRSLMYATEIANHIFQTDLEKINKIIIPLSEILFSKKMYTYAFDLLNESIKICEKHENLNAYIRKMQRLKYRVLYRCLQYKNWELFQENIKNFFGRDYTMHDILLKSLPQISSDFALLKSSSGDNVTLYEINVLNIPLADRYLEEKNYTLSIGCINSGIHLCEVHNESIVCQDIKIKLLERLIIIYKSKNDNKGIRITKKQIRKETKKFRKILKIK